MFKKDNYKLIFGIITGILLSGTFVYAATIYEGSIITYNNSNLSSTNVQDALDELYGMCANYGLPASLFVESLYNDGSAISSVYIGGSTSNPTVSLNATQGIMLDNNGEYRYYGADPNNYVSFNDELWRIISVSYVEDENGTVEPRLKIIRSESIGSFSYDNKTSGLGTSTSSDGSNDWTDARLMMLLNPGYESGVTDSSGNTIYGYEGSLYWNSKSGTCYSGSSNGTTSCDFTSTGLGSTAQSMIGKAKFYLGGSSTYFGLYADDYYNFERGTTVYSGHATEWTGYVGIMYASDYMYAADLSTCTQVGRSTSGSSYDYRSCTGSDWLFLTSSGKYFIDPDSATGVGIFYYGEGEVSTGYGYFRRTVHPSVYLKSSVSIVGGEGSTDNPYQLSIGT